MQRLQLFLPLLRELLSSLRGETLSTASTPTSNKDGIHICVRLYSNGFT